MFNNSQILILIKPLLTKRNPKMNKLLLSSLLLLAISQSLSFPVDFVSLENTERSMISRFRNWHPYVEYNRDLMKIAQEEAMRMAKLGKLEMPDFNFGKDKYYTGHCYRVLSYDVDLTNSSNLYFFMRLYYSYILSFYFIQFHF